MATASGFVVDESEVNPALKPHTRLLIRWAVSGGRRAIFASFGLHKTATQIEIARLVRERAGGEALICLPLGVRQEFFREAVERFRGAHAVDLRFIRRADEVEPDVPGRIHLTNYETIRDGKLDPNLFTVASLDEASVLRSFGSKTYHEFLARFADVPYRFVATATPSPNRFKELIHYAGFLGIMDTGQALTRFFQRNSESAGDLTLYPHKTREFFLWLNSWAAFVTKPSDLGFSDNGYALPPIRVTYHEVKANLADAGEERDGQGILFRGGARGLAAEARERRDTLPARMEKLRAIVAADPKSHRIIWHDLEDERRAIEDALPIRSFDQWDEFKDGHPDGLALYDRHYSAHQYADGRERKLFCGPGEKTVLLTRDRSALFVWRRFIDDSGQTGVNCAVFRNEGRERSSGLIKEAMAIAWARWPGERLYTYVDQTKIRSKLPGKCFRKAGWQLCGATKGGLLILEAVPGLPIPSLSPADGLASVYGSQDLDEREARIIAFSDGAFRFLAAKPVIAGSGCNFQRHCHKAVFLGVSHKFNNFIQAIHRIQRFGQAHPVEIDIIHAESEREVVRDLAAKWARHEELRDTMGEIVREFGLDAAAMEGVLTRSIGVDRMEASGAGWLVANNDCVAETRLMEENSVDQIVTSIPFSNHYEYTPSYNDFGHTDDDDHFFGQLDFLTPELLRVLKPGRIAAIHVKDRILFGSVTGMGRPTVNPFHATCIFHYRRHGFAYLGMVTVNTDVVRENNQTYRLGYSEMRKDGSRMGVGSPEYVLLFCKPQTDRSKGYADERVTKAREDYSLARWQIDAHAFWRSSGDRLLTADELAAMGPDQLARIFTDTTRSRLYDFETHVRIGEALEARGALPSIFMALAPGAHDPDIWDDVNRLGTLNTAQSAKNREKHVCPLQFDIVDRLIERYSNPGDLIYDPFGGLFTVPYRALGLGRRGRAAELSHGYFLDGIKYLEAKEREIAMPSLLDVLGAPREVAA